MSIILITFVAYFQYVTLILTKKIANMNKDKTIERLRAKLAEKDQEVKALKKEVKKLKKEEEIMKIATQIFRETML